MYPQDGYTQHLPLCFPSSPILENVDAKYELLHLLPWCCEVSVRKNPNHLLVTGNFKFQFLKKITKIQLCSFLQMQLYTTTVFKCQFEKRLTTPVSNGPPYFMVTHRISDVIVVEPYIPDGILSFLCNIVSICFIKESVNTLIFWSLRKSASQETTVLEWYGAGTGMLGWDWGRGGYGAGKEQGRGAGQGGWGVVSSYSYLFLIWTLTLTLNFKFSLQMVQWYIVEFYMVR